MKTTGIGGGAAYPASQQARKKEPDYPEGYRPSKEKKVYVRRPLAASMGQVPVQEAFERMAASGNRVYRALSELEGYGLTDRTEQEKRGMERFLQEYEQNLPQEDKAGGVEKTETESEIIVKPDGSRVLVVTTITNGVVTSVQSMEISKPTDAPNESGEEGEAEGEQEGEADNTEDAGQELGAMSRQVAGQASGGN